jgi:hypothetical protein
VTHFLVEDINLCNELFQHLNPPLVFPIVLTSRHEVLPFFVFQRLGQLVTDCPIFLIFYIVPLLFILLIQAPFRAKRCLRWRAAQGTNVVI